MFNVIRPVTVPASLAKKRYNHADVVNVLKLMFHEKCYLCERNEIQDVEVEHFKPHMSVEADKFDWNNLYYSCSRCNSIKGATHKDLLDCTDSSINVFSEIILKMSPATDDDVFVAPSKENPSNEVTKTVELLKLCYNSTNTALRGVSRESLIEQIYSFLVTFITARSLLKKPSTGKSIKNNAEEIIEAMLDDSHPFCAFWRWQYLHDSFLVANYPNLEIAFNPAKVRV
jgi:uncharacterized protein (TIGR02646 family)